MTAWALIEGDELVDDIGTVILLSRDARARTVRVLTSERVAAALPGDSPVVVLRSP